MQPPAAPSTPAFTPVPAAKPSQPPPCLWPLFPLRPTASPPPALRETAQPDSGPSESPHMKWGQDKTTWPSLWARASSSPASSGAAHEPGTQELEGAWFFPEGGSALQAQNTSSLQLHTHCTVKPHLPLTTLGSGLCFSSVSSFFPCSAGF